MPAYGSYCGKVTRGQVVGVKQKNQELLEQFQILGGTVRTCKSSLWLRNKQPQNLNAMHVEVSVSCSHGSISLRQLPSPCLSSPCRTNWLPDLVLSRSMAEAQENSPSVQAQWKPPCPIGCHPSVAKTSHRTQPMAEGGGSPFCLCEMWTGANQSAPAFKGI